MPRACPAWPRHHAARADAGIPTGERSFATKPALARELITRAVTAHVPASWVTGDEVYGADPRLRAAVRGHRLGYVLAIAANRQVPTPAGKIRADRLPAILPKRAWQKHSAGTGAHGHRLYSWAWIDLLPEDVTDTGRHYLLIRRNDRTGELAYLRCYAPRPTTLHTLVRVAGQRWRIEESFQAAKGLTGLDQHQVRRWTSWHRWTTLAMLAHAFLAVACATERDTAPTPVGLIALTVNDSQSVLSSRGGVVGGGLLVVGVVAEHGPQHVVSSACQREDGLGVAFALGALAGVVVLGGWVVVDAELGCHIRRAKQPAIESSWPVEVAADAPGVARHRC